MWLGLAGREPLQLVPHRAGPAGPYSGVLHWQAAAACFQVTRAAGCPAMMPPSLGPFPLWQSKSLIYWRKIAANVYNISLDFNFMIWTVILNLNLNLNLNRDVKQYYDVNNHV